MLLKVHKDTHINIINKSPIIKANREYKQEKVLKKKVLIKQILLKVKEIEFKELFKRFLLQLKNFGMSQLRKNNLEKLYKD